MQSLVIVQDEEMLEDYVCILPHFIRHFLHTQDNHVTVIHPEAHLIAPSARNKEGGLAVRIIPSVDLPPIQMSRHVLRLLGKPVFVATCTVGESMMLPDSYEDIDNIIKSGVEYISPLLFGIDETANFSMVVKYDPAGHITVLRK